MQIETNEPGFAAAAGAKPPPRIVIRPVRGWSALQLGEVWAYRDLLYFMIWREINGRYRQTALGITWVFIRPVVNVLLMSLVFGAVLNVPSEGVPYPLFSLAALLPWGYFSTAVSRSANSLVDNMGIISKVYFPRLLVPLASTTSGLIDFGASMIIFFVLLFFYRMPLRWQMLWLPLLVLVTMAFALAAGLWLATLSVKYRDVAFAVGFLLQALMYASPVIYPVSAVPAALQPFYALNPMTGVIEGFRWALLGIGEPPGPLFLLSSAMIAVLLVSGAYIFRRTERTIVDIL